MITYEEYIVLSDKCPTYRGDFSSYCYFKEVMELANTISLKRIDTYLYEGNHYTLPIKLTELDSALDSIKSGEVNKDTIKLKEIAKQVGIRRI
tara:strand:+ start:539 stop:817 length:279 start_codon:yes stop_codon:yes gene_type:complete